MSPTVSPSLSHPSQQTLTQPRQIESLRAHERDCVLPAFDGNVAWELGTIIRARCQKKHRNPAVIYIAYANSSHLLFFATSRPGTLPDQMHWVKRREAVVLRWGVSSSYMREQLLQAKPSWPVLETLKDRYEIADPTKYACLGGAFPVRVKNVGGIVGVIVVSGLGHDGHEVIVDSIKEYLRKHK
ncbi:hypothetical protein HD554DRAFT_2044563 [Boletus coccyginus]|nr:hypothetical protein HD554DRAFT_2044563 [Boletus coccyginus]